MTRYSPKQLATAFYELLAEAKTAVVKKQLIIRFAAYIQKIGAGKMLNEIERHFEIIRLKKENAVKVEIALAEKKQPIFPTKINGKKVELFWRTALSLIAGSVIRIGDMRIDNSIRRRLKDLIEAIRD